MENWTTDYISPEEAPNLHCLFRVRAQRSPDAIAYRFFNSKQNTWIEYTWAQSLEQIEHWRRALSASGIKKNEAVGIMLKNCPEWIFIEQACMAEGIVSVPLYPNDRPDNVSYIINESEIRLILIEDMLQWKTLQAAQSDIIEAPIVISLSEIKPKKNPVLSLISAANWLQSAQEQPLEDIYNNISIESLATIVYTSGTTGRPKGVMLSHQNILYNAYYGIQSVTVYAQDLFLSFLPLSHTLERTVGYYIPVMTGATVAFSRSIPQLAEDLLTIKPTVLISVPRIYERVYGKIIGQIEDKPAIAQKLFALTEKIGWEKYEHEQGRRPTSWRLLLWPILNKLVAKKVMDKLGGRLRFSISGGAPLPEAVGKLFIAFGLRVLQGYGLTESSPIISVNRLESDQPASIGIALPEVNVRLGDNQELQTHSKCVMLGYWKNEQASKETFTDDGWLKTGDLARIDGEHIYITGRIKEILVLSNGEKVPPVDMEIAITLDPLFEQAMVIGEGRPYLSAVVVLEKTHWENLAKTLELNADDPASLKNAKVKSIVQNRISRCLSDFPGYAQVRQVTLSLEVWTDENFFLTAAMKVRRKVLMEHFHDDIINMYKNH